MLFAYKQALLTLRHFPELWHEAARYCAATGAPAEAVDMYNKGLEALPGRSVPICA